MPAPPQGGGTLHPSPSKANVGADGSPAIHTPPGEDGRDLAAFVPLLPGRRLRAILASRRNLKVAQNAVKVQHVAVKTEIGAVKVVFVAVKTVIGGSKTRNGAVKT